MRRVRIEHDAEVELLAAAAWYRQQRPGLEAEFDQAVDDALARLEDDVAPLSAIQRSRGGRDVFRPRLGRFPYDAIVVLDDLDWLVHRLRASSAAARLLAGPHSLNRPHARGGPSRSMSDRAVHFPHQ